MSRLHCLVGSVAVATLALLTHATSAHADTPDIVPTVAAPTAASLATPARIALTTASASPIGSLMVVLDVLGIKQKDAPKPSATTRTATFLSPEPPKTPLFYSSLVVAKF